MSIHMPAHTNKKGDQSTRFASLKKSCLSSNKKQNQSKLRDSWVSFTVPWSYRNINAYLHSQLKCYLTNWEQWCTLLNSKLVDVTGSQQRLCTHHNCALIIHLFGVMLLLFHQPPCLIFYTGILLQNLGEIIHSWWTRTIQTKVLKEQRRSYI